MGSPQLEEAYKSTAVAKKKFKTNVNFNTIEDRIRVILTSQEATRINHFLVKLPGRKESKEKKGSDKQQCVENEARDQSYYSCVDYKGKVVRIEREKNREFFLNMLVVVVFYSCINHLLLLLS